MLLSLDCVFRCCPRLRRLELCGITLFGALKVIRHALQLRELAIDMGLHERPNGQTLLDLLSSMPHLKTFTFRTALKPRCLSQFIKLLADARQSAARPPLQYLESLTLHTPHGKCTLERWILLITSLPLLRYLQFTMKSTETESPTYKKLQAWVADHRPRLILSWSEIPVKYTLQRPDISTLSGRGPIQGISERWTAVTDLFA